MVPRRVHDELILHRLRYVAAGRLWLSLDWYWAGELGGFDWEKAPRQARRLRTAIQSRDGPRHKHHFWISCTCILCNSA